MNRRIVAILVALFTLGLLCTVLYCHGFSRAFSSYYVSDEEWTKIFYNRTENKELDLSSLKFNGYDLNFTEDEAYYSIVANGLHDFDPIVSLSGSYKFAARGERLNEQVIENNSPIEIVIYNNREYRKFNLVSTTLPILNISFDTESGYAPGTREDELFKMTLFDNRPKALNRVIRSDGAAHRRGNISFDVDKPNLSLKLTQESVGENTRNNPKDLLGMDPSDSWILSGMYYDYEKVRDAFAANLWSSFNANSFSIKNSFNFRYVEVIMNDEYYGLYLLGSKPTVASISSEIADEKHPDIMFKIEDSDDLASFITDQTNILTNYKQESHVDDKLAREVLRDYYKSVFGDDIVDIESSADMRNAVDFHLFVNFSQNVDIPRGGLAGYKNCYLSFKWNGERYQAIFTPWDFDIALGTNNLFGEYYDLLPEQNSILDSDSIAALRRNGSNKGDLLVQSRYRKLRQGELSNTKIDELINELEADIYNSGAFRRNQERWTDSKHGDPNIKLNDFRTFIHRRLEYLDGYYGYGEAEYLNEPYFEVPNYITEYLNNGTLLSPDDPNYYVKQEELVEFEPEMDTELEPVLWQ